MRVAIIPLTKLAAFDRPITPDQPWIRVGPVKIHSGPFAGNYAVGEAILSSCPEWRAVADQALALVAADGIQIEEVALADFADPAVSRPI